MNLYIKSFQYLSPCCDSISDRATLIFSWTPASDTWPWMSCRSSPSFSGGRKEPAILQQFNAPAQNHRCFGHMTDFLNFHWFAATSTERATIMADPDIRRMGKKHKKHKKEYSQYHNIRLPGKFNCVKLFGLKCLLF